MKLENSEVSLETPQVTGVTLRYRVNTGTHPEPDSPPRYLIEFALDMSEFFNESVSLY
jgi:hypothetical protein